MNAWAIKIGGSLYDSPYLVEWLNVIDQYSSTKIVIIPGGGPFANQVRRADEKYHLSPIHSHNMAVMAMQQYGTILASLCPNMKPANALNKIHEVWGNSKVAIWEPYRMVSEECELDKTWDVTSDSLSVWLSSKLNLKKLLLIKSSDYVLEEKNITVLSNKNCIDSNFQTLANDAKICAHVLHKTELNAFKTLLGSR